MKERCFLKINTRSQISAPEPTRSLISAAEELAGSRTPSRRSSERANRRTGRTRDATGEESGNGSCKFSTLRVSDQTTSGSNNDVVAFHLKWKYILFFSVKTVLFLHLSLVDIGQNARDFDRPICFSHFCQLGLMRKVFCHCSTIAGHLRKHSSWRSICTICIYDLMNWYFLSLK